MWCEAEIDKIEDDEKILQNKIVDLKAASDDAKGCALKTEIEALDGGIRALD